MFNCKDNVGHGIYKAKSVERDGSKDAVQKLKHLLLVLPRIDEAQWGRLTSVPSRYVEDCFTTLYRREKIAKPVRRTQPRIARVAPTLVRAPAGGGGWF